jgi:hypothetical protein
MTIPTLGQQEKWFWALVDGSRTDWSLKRANGNQKRQQARLEAALSEMPLSEVARFNRMLRKLMREAYRWNVWGAVYVLAGGCSDDAFADFRSWLVSMGRREFKAVIKNPEHLCEIAEMPGVESVFFPGFQHAAARVFRKRSGKEIPISLELAIDIEPRGRKWASEDELRRKFPTLWRLYRD